MYGITDGAARLYAITFICAVVFTPLGIWKFVELAIWFFSHLSWQ